MSSIDHTFDAPGLSGDALAIARALGRSNFDEARVRTCAIMAIAERLSLSEVQLLASALLSLLGRSGEVPSSDQSTALLHLVDALRALDGP
jgi:hypothetical protein